MQHLGPVARLLGLGSYLATCIAGGPIAGYYLDRWLDTRPLWTLIGLALGLIVGLYGAYRMLAQTLPEMNRTRSSGLEKKD